MKLFRWWEITLFLIAATILSIGLFSCNPARKLARIADNHPITAAQFCAGRYPVRDSVSVQVHTVRDTMLLPGEMITVNCDSTHDTLNHLVYVQCPPVRLIREMVTKDSIVFRENTAALTATRLQLTDKTAEAKKEKDAKQGWRKWCLVLGTAWLIVIGLKAWKIIKRVKPI